jgi:hypothetical protein
MDATRPKSAAVSQDTARPAETEEGKTPLDPGRKTSAARRVTPLQRGLSIPPLALPCTVHQEPNAYRFTVPMAAPTRVRVPAR